MELQGKVTVVTGAAGGIGKALAERFHAEGASVVLADREAAPLDATVAKLNATRPNSAFAVAANLGTEQANADLVRASIETFGQIDLFFANAGVGLGSDLSTSEQDWDTAFDINFNAHRWAAKYLLPDWLARGEGYFCSTASAAGLLSQIGSAPYTVTKHAAVAFAEWMSITYGGRGKKRSIQLATKCARGVHHGAVWRTQRFGLTLQRTLCPQWRARRVNAVQFI